MRRTTRHISPLQYAIVETTAFMGIGIFEFPRLLILHAGNNAWWGFLLDWAAAYGGAWLLLKVAYVAPRETLLGMTRRIWPGPLYWVFGILDELAHLGLPVIALTQFTYLIVTFFLPNTAPWMIELVLTAMAAYIAWWDLPVLARTIQVIYIPVMVISLALLVLLAPHLTDSYALVPSWNFHVSAIVSGGYRSFYIFVGYEAIPIFWPYVQPEAQARARQYTYWALTLSGVFYALIFAATLGTEDPWYLSHLEWPGVSALRLISVTGLLIDKLGLLIVVLWGLLSLSFISIRFWAITHVALPVIRKRSLTWYRGILVGLAATVLGMSLLIPNIATTDKWTARLMPGLLAFIVIYPVAFIITARFGQKKPKPSAKVPAGSR